MRSGTRSLPTSWPCSGSCSRTTWSRPSPPRSARASPDPTPPTLDPDRARTLLAGPTLEAARGLIGAHLIRDPHPASGSERRVVRVVEVEAYIGADDRASHARFGRTARNEVMYGPPGVAYVYLVYGMYDCLNIVTEPVGRAAAVLIRAAEPVAGLEAMRAARAAHRSTRARAPAATRSAPEPVADIRLASGPGVLCAALSIDRSMTGQDLLAQAGLLRLELPPKSLPPERIGSSPRIGIGYAPEPWRSLPWRLFDLASAAVSDRRARPA